MLPLTVPPCFYFQKGWIKEEGSINLGERFCRIRQPEIYLQMVALGRKELKLAASLGNEGGLGVVLLSERVELSLLFSWTGSSQEQSSVVDFSLNGKAEGDRIRP